MRIPALVLGHLWCAPLTVLGLIVALIGRSRFLGRCGSALEFSAVPGGLIDAVFRGTRTVGAGGMWGAVVFYADPLPSTSVRLHEHRHCWQALVLGPLWPVAYAVCSLVAVVLGGNAYRDNAMERDARRAERS